MTTMTKIDLEREMRVLLGEELQKAAEPIINEAVEKLIRQIRQRVADVAVLVADHMSLETLGRDLRITVKFDGLKPK